MPWWYWNVTGTHGWLLGWNPPGLWSGSVHCVALLSLSCLGLGTALERLLRRWWVWQGFPVDTECTEVWDYGFPVGLENPAWDLLCPVWLLDMAGVVWLHCSCGLSAVQVGSPARWLAEGTINLLVSPTVLAWSGQCDLTGSVVKWARVVALFAISAMTYRVAQKKWGHSVI